MFIVIVTLHLLQSIFLPSLNLGPFILQHNVVKHIHSIFNFFSSLSYKGCGRHCASSDNAGAQPKWWGRWWSKLLFFLDDKWAPLEVLANVRVRREELGAGKWQILCVISKKQKCQNTPLNPRYASEDEHVDSRDSQNLFQRSTLGEIMDDGMLIACGHPFSVAYWWNTTKCLCVLQLSSVPSIVCPFKGPVCKILYHLMVRRPYCKQMSVFYWSMFSLRPCCNANDETVIRLVG